MYCTSTHKRRNGLLEADVAAAVEVVRRAIKLPTMSELLYSYTYRELVVYYYITTDSIYTHLTSAVPESMKRPKNV